MSDDLARPAREDAVTPDAWAALSRFTSARIALGRSGGSLPTAELLRFGLAHARARDAVHRPLDGAAVEADLVALGLAAVRVASAASSRALYLRRPDLGRRLSEDGRAALAAVPEARPDLAIVVADGLSSSAIHVNLRPFLAELLPRLRRAGRTLAPVVVATQARVALGDEVGALLRARAVAVLVGERPGLGSPDSLGAYLTLAPAPGRTDAERNCISNIRPGGLGPAEAAFKLAWLLDRAFALGLTGIGLKDESDAAATLGGGAEVPGLAPPTGPR